MNLKLSVRGTGICLLTPKPGNVPIRTRMIERAVLDGNPIAVGTLAIQRKHEDKNHHGAVGLQMGEENQ